MVPLAEKSRRITKRFDRFGNRHFLGWQIVVIAPYAGMDRVFPSQKGRPAGGTHHRCRVATLKHPALFRQPVQVGSRPFRSTVKADVAPAEVVRNDHDDIGGSFAFGGIGR